MKPAFDVVDAHVDLASKARFGQVVGGSATLIGLLKAAINTGLLGERMGNGYNPVYNLEMAPIGRMKHDARDDLQTKNITCFKLYDNESSHSEHFLVLVPVQNGGTNPFFRRIGLGDTLLWGRSRYEDKSFFEGCEKETITII